MKGLFYLLMLATLTCCYTKKQAVRKFCPPSEVTRSTTSSDSTHSLISTSSILDSTSVIPATHLETLFNPCDSLGAVIENLNLALRSGTGTLTVRSDAGVVRVNCSCDSVVQRYRKEIHSRDSTIAVLQNRETSTEITRHIESPNGSGWGWIIRWIYLTTAGLVLCWLITRKK